jgi:hypothetical protein
MNAQDNSTKEMIKTVKKLYCNPKYSQTHIILSIMCICFTNVYFLTLYNSKNLKGDEFTIGILFGLAEFIGVLFGEKLMRLVPEIVGYKYSLMIAIILDLSIKVFDLTQSVTYVLFLI